MASGRRFLWRWNLRVLRAQWRQHLSLFVLIAVAVAAGIAGVLTAFRLVEPPENTFGTAEVVASTTGDATGPHQALVDQGHRFGTVERARLRLSGQTARVPIRVQDPDNPVTAPLLDLIEGRWPRAASEIAVTDNLVDSWSTGEMVQIGDRTVTVVGLVENPTDLTDEFALVTDLDPFGVPDAERVTQFLVEAKPADVTFPIGSGRITLASRSSLLDERTAVALAVNGVAAVAMLEVALLVGAGFAVLARRRIRQYGLLGAAGATPAQIRRAATTAGVILGLAAAVVGMVGGLIAAAMLVPVMESSVGHRISYSVPWWTVVPTVVLAVTAAGLGARWPARPLAKLPVADLLAARRPPPATTGGSTVAGSILAGVGAVAIVVGFARLNTVMATVGIVVAPIGLLLLAPLLVRLIGTGSARLPLAARIGGRSVGRYNRRSAAVVAALAIALGVPAGLAIVTSSIDRYEATKLPNLEDRWAIAWLPGVEEPVPHIPSDLVGANTDDIEGRLATALPGATVASISVAVPADAPLEQETFETLGSRSSIIPLFAAEPGDSNCLNCDIFAFGTVDENGDEILYVESDAWVASPKLLTALGLASPDPGVTAIAGRSDLSLAAPDGLVTAIEAGIKLEPTIPNNPSIAPLLIMPETVEAQSFERVSVAWLVVAESPITDEQRAAVADAAGQDLVVEFHREPQPRSALRLVGLAAGLLVGLGIAVAAVSLFAQESADEMRTLLSIGARPRTSRALSASVAAALSLAGATIAVLIGYLALLPLLTIDDIDFPFVVPWPHLAAVLVAFPLMAAGAGWLLPGRTPNNLLRTSTP